MFIFSAKIYTVCILFLKKYNAPGTLPFTFFVNIFKLKKKNTQNSQNYLQHFSRKIDIYHTVQKHSPRSVTIAIIVQVKSSLTRKADRRHFFLLWFVFLFVCLYGCFSKGKRVSQESVNR